MRWNRLANRLATSPSPPHTVVNFLGCAAHLRRRNTLKSAWNGSCSPGCWTPKGSNQPVALLVLGGRKGGQAGSREHSPGHTPASPGPWIGWTAAGRHVFHVRERGMYDVLACLRHGTIRYPPFMPTDTRARREREKETRVATSPTILNSFPQPPRPPRTPQRKHGFSRRCFCGRSAFILVHFGADTTSTGQSRLLLQVPDSGANSSTRGQTYEARCDGPHAAYRTEYKP